ncbi:MAG: hypothetical protein H6Q04_3000, partial [Acidobacteria bacterium]|nr:hypothetical protein [Acidobacteriota bacterium]
KFTEDQFLINTDLVLSKKHTLTEKFLFSRAPQLSSFGSSGGFSSVSAGNYLPGAPLEILYQNVNAGLKLTSALSSNLGNEVRVSFQHDISRFTPLIPFTNQQVGIASLVPQIDMLDTISVVGLFTAGGSQGNWEDSVNNYYIVSDQISWIHGRQTIRAGFESVRRQLNSQTFGSSIGTLTFQSFPDFLLGLPGCLPGADTCDPGTTNGTAFSNVFSTSGVLSAPGGIYHAPRLPDYSAFVQHDIRINSRLTWSAGIRWDYFGLPVDLSGNNTNVWPRLIREQPLLPAEGTYIGYVVAASFNGALPPGVYRNTLDTAFSVPSSLRNFAPRVGFAWQVLGNARLLVRGGYGYFHNRPDVDITAIHLISNPPYGSPASGSGTANYFSSLAQPFSANIPLWGNPRNVNFETGKSSNISTRMIEEHYGTPVTQKWNLDLQYEFLPKWTVVVGYAGSHSIRILTLMHTINAALLAGPGNPVNGVTANTVANAPLRVPYLGFAPNGMGYQENAGSSNYNSLQVSLRKQISHGVQFGIAYTFNRTLTDNNITNSPIDFRQHYGPDTASRPQRFVLNYRWELPYTGSGIAGKFLGGWSLSGVTAIQSGSPLTITDGRGGTIYGSASSARAQLCPGISISDLATSGSTKQRLDAYFNPTAFCAPPTIGNGTGYGNSGVGIIRGPGQANWDLSLNKSIKIQKSRMEIRAEFFNILNHAQFASPNATCFRDLRIPAQRQGS